MHEIGLVLEGGGMRGVYTAGVLDFFMEKNLYFPYVIGVSAGACNAASYISKQIGRNKTVLIDYVKHPDFGGLKTLINEKSLFGMKLIFEDIPIKYEPFSFHCFFKNKQKFIITATDVEKAQPYYIDKHEIMKNYSFENRNDKILQAIKASSSLPFISPSVEFNGIRLLDGGICDPIPIKKSENDGMLRNVIILTRDKFYRKKPFKYAGVTRKIYNQKFSYALSNRHKKYNDTLDYIEQLQVDKKAFIIRPSKPLNIDRFERNQSKLEKAYNIGYEDALYMYRDLLKWMETEKQVTNY
ncbi:putative patatin/cPLA2 family phospholipase [Clostridium algifaecis]|uniref:Patatin/cPLA2 family phospholipase n=1 Tax=Clostridium algifaecis TaxID=1472040 RepID=A0ABS4KYT5_9CLOT|nr:patatin family protein [Clostridium algifaecis]MBP2034029.1 putative patatin/cPLA2 family phospholipase [Clostridium algifaecis]